MKFSIIIPFYNDPLHPREGMIDALIKSIPDRNDVEILVVDDRSPKPYTPKNPHQHTTLHILSTPPSQRYAGSARNTGIKAASGDALLFADSDDMFIPHNLIKILDSAKADQDWEMILFKTSSFNAKGLAERHESIENRINLYQKNPTRDGLVKIIFAYGRILKKEFLLDEGIFFQDTKVSNDVLFSVLVAARDPKTIVKNLVCYNIRDHDHSLVKDESIDALKLRIEVFAHANRLLKKEGMKARFTSYYLIKPLISSKPLLAAQLVQHTLKNPDCLLIPQDRIQNNIRKFFP